MDTPNEALTVSLHEKACVDLAFMKELCGLEEQVIIDDLRGVIFKDPINGEWEPADQYLSGNVLGKNADLNNVRTTIKFGTKRVNAYKLLEDALNQKDTKIWDKVYEDGQEKRVINKTETLLAGQKQEMIKEAYRNWIFNDVDRREQLCKVYNQMYNAIRPREFDGSHLTFPGMSPDIKLRRLQLANKPIINVPNHLVGQWASDFLTLYPGANILASTKKDFEPANRKKFCSRISTGNYDSVIIGHSQFEKIPLSKERQARMVERQINEITMELDFCYRDSYIKFDDGALHQYAVFTISTVTGIRSRPL